MRYKLLIFITLMLYLSGCSNTDKISNVSTFNSISNKNKLNILITYDKSYEEELGTFPDLIFNKFIEEFGFENNVLIEKKYLSFSTQSDLKKKLASIVYTQNDYDLVLFNDSYIRSPFDSSEVMESLNHLNNYNSVFNCIKNEYFVPIGYSVFSPAYSIDFINFIQNDAFKDKSDALTSYLRKSNLYPTILVMESEACNQNLEYQLSNNTIKFNLDNVYNFRNSLQKILNQNYNLSYNGNPDTIKNIFSLPYKDWGKLDKEAIFQSKNIKSKIMLINVFSALNAQNFINGNIKDTKYIPYLHDISKDDLTDLISIGVFKSSKNKDLAFKFVNDYISEDFQKNITNNTAASRGLLPGIINKNLVTKLCEKELKLGVKSKIIENRNTIFVSLDKDIGSFISYNKLNDEDLKKEVFYIIRPYLLKDYDEDEVKKQIKKLEEQINIKLSE